MKTVGFLRFFFTMISCVTVVLPEIQAQTFVLDVYGAARIRGRVDVASDTTSLFIGKNAGIIDDGTYNHNTYVGVNAGKTNLSGSYNTASGYRAMYINSAGSGNTAYGHEALFSNVSASENVALGVYALYWNTYGWANTAIGARALDNNVTGFLNTGLGSESDMSNNFWNNATAIGAYAVVNDSNKVRIGASDVTIIEGQVPFSYPSDARFKNNIREDVPGLEFITQLKPVSYYFDTRKFEEHLLQNMPESVRQRKLADRDFEQSSHVLHSGFLAQDVEKVCKSLKYDFDGLHIPNQNNNTDHYSIAYSQFVVPLVKAVQEQQVMIEEKKRRIEVLEEKIKEIDNIQARLAQLEELLNQNAQKTTANQVITIEEGAELPRLLQNVPNPFKDETTIYYFLPESVQRAQLRISNVLGQEIQRININDSGEGSVRFHTRHLPADTYLYELIINDVSIEQKTMILQR